MKFSIIVPIYKVEKYLRTCVDSVLKQSYKDFELILVDDGSPDYCPQICDEYAAKDPRVQVVHQNNAGIACARNVGITLAKGEYIISIDSDDYLINETVLSAIEEKTWSNPDVVMFGYRKFFESDKSWGEPICPKLSPGLSTAQSLKELLSNGSYIATAWTKAVRRDVLVCKNIMFKPGMVSGEDVDWYLNLLCSVDKFEVLQKACIAYRQRSDSISHNPKIQSLTDFIWILEEWPKFFDERNISSELKNSLMNAMAYYWANVMVLYSTFDAKEAQPYRNRLKALGYMNNYAITSRALTMKKFYKAFGFDTTILLLKFLGKIKKRQ